MEELHCDNNLLLSLDVSGAPTLNILCCTNNKLTALDVSCNPDLEYLFCQDNRITIPNLENNTKLRNINYDKTVTFTSDLPSHLVV